MGIAYFSRNQTGALPWRPELVLKTSRGPLSARLAQDEADVAAAQALRHRVFHAERGLSGADTDADRFDPICDHLLVTDTRDGALVGTYRLLRQEVAEAHGGFYSQDEYDLRPLLARQRHLRFLELGRSCVLKEYRTKPVIELLWQAIWDYVRHHGLDAMLGCASFEGTDPDAHAPALAWLARNHGACEDWRVRALAHRYAAMDRLPGTDVDDKAALKALPPLIKGYLRLGAQVGDGAVVDHAFNTVDVLILLPVERIEPRYFGRFGTPQDSVRTS
ncbi:MAG: GNAT family N-acetyltransferase [Parvibaculaceae bacterium]